METLEIVADSVEEAIDTGLARLGALPHQVMVEVLEEPSRGFLGMGSRQAKVRLTLLGRPPSTAPEHASSADPVARLDVTGDAYQDDATEIEAPFVPQSVNLDDVHEDALVARQVLIDLLGHMGYADYQVDVRRAEAPADAPSEEDHWILNVDGDDLSHLIGRKGDTLSALQYLVRLMTSKKLERRANIIIDVGDYRSDRSNRLERLASRMADQAARQGRAVTLEPMPAHERRIIHMALRQDQRVSTQSVGEGDARKVQIIPVE
jgi:spoIIIJ-associated protein